MSLAISYLADR